MLDWNDLRYFLAVAREGSTLAAGRALRVSQTTVARRIAALEQALGFPLFEKRQAGYALTPTGHELIARAEQAERALNAFSDDAAARSRDLSGTVKITTEEVYALTLLAPLLTELHQLHPEIMIDLDTSQIVRDLGAGEADISLRSVKTGNQAAGLVGRELCVDEWALYCSRSYAARHGSPDDGCRDEEAFVHRRRRRQSVDSLPGVAPRARAGKPGGDAPRDVRRAAIRCALRVSGSRCLPCIVADGDPDLVRCVPPRSDHDRTLWLFTHERVRHTPRVRTVIDFLYERLSRHVRQCWKRQERRPAA